MRHGQAPIIGECALERLSSLTLRNRNVNVRDANAPSRRGARNERASTSTSDAAGGIPDSEQLELQYIFNFEQLDKFGHLASFGEHDRLDAESDFYSCVAIGAEVDMDES